MQIVVVIIIMLICGIDAFNNFAGVECGKVLASPRRGRIVGGMNATKGEFPWLVSLTRHGGHFCGGSVINKKYILTAGHCFCTGIDNGLLNPISIKVTLSQHDLTQTADDTFELGIKSLTVHPEYVCNKKLSDIAILELEKELGWSDTVQPVCLPLAEGKGYNKFNNIKATVAGWGWTNEDRSLGGRAKVLQKANVNVIENDMCNEWYKLEGKKTEIQGSQMCAGYKEGRIDACWADSGGPLMVRSSKEHTVMQIGVVSTGIGCARKHLPGIYTRVSEFIPWIREVINQ